MNWLRIVLVMLGCIGCCDHASAVSGAALERLLWLQGQWTGESHGVAGPARLRRDMVCALQCSYLNVEAEYRSLQDNPKGEYSRALGMWTFHHGRQRLLLHTFDDMAAVTTYTEDPATSSARQLVMIHRDERSGTRTRFVYTFTPPDGFHERFEQAAPGADWRVYAESRFVRTTRDGAGAPPGHLSTPIQ